MKILVNTFSVVVPTVLTITTAFASSPAPYCTPKTHEQRTTGFETGVLVSSLATVGATIFFVSDSARSGKGGENVLVASLASLGPFLAFTVGSSCISVSAEEIESQHRVVVPFKSRVEAIKYRKARIKTHTMILGINFLSAGLMYFLVDDTGSQVATVAAATVPLGFSLLNLGNFSPDREIDESLSAGPSIHKHADRTYSPTFSLSYRF